MSDKEKVLSRISGNHDWKTFLEEITIMMGIGHLKSWDVVAIGLEDLNIKLETEKGSYLFKGFSDFRKPIELKRFREILSLVSDSDIPHPKFVKLDDRIVLIHKNVSFCVYEWVDGQSYYQLKRTPNDSEFSDIVKIAAEINSIKAKPSFLKDDWAIYNLPNFVKKYEQEFEPADLSIIKRALIEYERIDHDSLPHALVHGDITQQNLILSDRGKISIIDFSVANYYPRIQELSLIVSLLMSKSESIDSRIKKAVTEYEKYIQLTVAEKDAMFPYVVASQAMEIIGVYKERLAGNSLQELDYWIDIGRSGLKKSFEEIE